MKLATIRTAEGTRAVRLAETGGQAVHVDLGYDDLGAWLAAGSPADAPGARTFAVDGADFAPVVVAPSKVICVGHNYTNHIQEMGRELPSYPTLFPKFAETLIRANDDIVKPAETEALDREVELVVVVGSPVRRATQAQAAAAIAGFTVMNDISVRDWQFRTVEWTQGKIWDSSTPVGPYLVTPDELPGGVRPSLEVTTVVDGSAFGVAKDAAMRAHATQISVDGPFFALSNNIGLELAAVEYLRLVCGEPGGDRDADGRETDLFAGVA